VRVREDRSVGADDEVGTRACGAIGLGLSPDGPPLVREPARQPPRRSDRSRRGHLAIGSAAELALLSDYAIEAPWLGLSIVGTHNARIMAKSS
jgi:hypothetical protein